jgi:hypothetical protein
MFKPNILDLKTKYFSPTINGTPKRHQSTSWICVAHLRWAGRLKCILLETRDSRLSTKTRYNCVWFLMCFRDESTWCRDVDVDVWSVRCGGLGVSRCRRFRRTTGPDSAHSSPFQPHPSPHLIPTPMAHMGPNLAPYGPKSGLPMGHDGPNLAHDWAQTRAPHGPR